MSTSEERLNHSHNYQPSENPPNIFLEIVSNMYDVFLEIVSNMYDVSLEIVSNMYDVSLEIVSKMFLEVVKQCIETFIVGHNLLSSLSPLNTVFC